jgi:hypothetical protein
VGVREVRDQQSQGPTAYSSCSCPPAPIAHAHQRQSGRAISGFSVDSVLRSAGVATRNNPGSKNTHTLTCRALDLQGHAEGSDLDLLLLDGPAVSSLLPILL